MSRREKDSKNQAKTKDGTKRNRNKDKSIFDRELLNEKLIELERRALGLFELTNDAIFLLDLNGRYIDVNQRAAQMLGYNRLDMIGRSAYEFVSESEHKDSKQKLKDLKAGRILPIYEREFKRSDGTTFPVEINAAVVQDENGEPLYIQSAVRDISERVKAEKAQIKERKAFNLIAEATIYSQNINDLCQRIVEGITKLLGFDGSSIRGYNKENEMLSTLAYVDYSGSLKGLQLEPISIRNHNYIFTLSARNKRALISSRFEDRPLLAPYIKPLEANGIYAHITWPILDSNEELLGLIQLISRTSKEIPEEDIDFFETIARMFTVAFERKLAEEALKDSEEKYRSFAQNFQGIAFRMNTDWTPVFYNGAVKEITGYTMAELLKQNPRWEDIVHSEDLDLLLEKEKGLQNKSNYILDMEYRIIRKDGQIRWVHDTTQNVCDTETGEPIYVQGAIYDITERKRNERLQEILRKLGIDLSSIVNLTDALEIVLDSICKMDVVECGLAYYVDESSGFLSLATSKGSCSSFGKNLEYYSTTSPFTQAIMTGNSIYCDYPGIADLIKNDIITDDEIRSLAIIPITSENRIVAILALGSITTETIPLNTRYAIELITAQISGAIKRIRIEEALRESDEKYRTFVKYFQGIAYRINPKNELIFIGGSVEEITGYSSNDFLSKKTTRKDLIHPYDIDKLDELLTESKNSDDPKTGKFEYRIITKEGKISWVQDTWQVLTNDNDDFIGFQGSIINVTDRKIAQNELQKLYEDLEQRVQERTEQLSATNKELTAFSYSVSHDLRTPLRHIGGFADLLQKRIKGIDLQDERIISYSNKILGSVDEMNKLIDGLLTFSRMSRVDFVKIKINLTELVQDVLNDFQIELSHREIDLRFDFLPDVIGDPSLLRLVLVNLIGNALKFTKTRKLTEIHIGTKPSKDNDKFTIFIRDNGVGFDMKYYDRLFGVFQRLHKTEEFEGTGIGLATVQRVIRRMGGKIWAESELDKGTTFFFTLPKAANSD